MSGFDKYQAMQRLIAAGWEESHGEPYCMHASPELIERLVCALRVQVAGGLHVYDASDIHDTLLPDAVLNAAEQEYIR